MALLLGQLLHLAYFSTARRCSVLSGVRDLGKFRRKLIMFILTMFIAKVFDMFLFHLCIAFGIISSCHLLLV